MKQEETTNEQEEKQYDHACAASAYFGVCPLCRCNHGYLNIRRVHFFVCHTHRKRWVAGENLFSCWRGETEADWEENWTRIQNYEDVEPIYPESD